MEETNYIKGYLTVIDGNFNHSSEWMQIFGDDIKGIVLRLKGGEAYYFNSNGIYSKTKQATEDRIPTTYR